MGNTSLGRPIADSQAIEDTTSSAGTWVSLDLQDVRRGVGILADTSGSATLTIQVSRTGDFNGEEKQPQTIDYSSAVVNLEQFDFSYQHVRAKLNQNVNDLEIVARGI